MSNENVGKTTKKSVLITVNRELHDWSKGHLDNFSGFVEGALMKLSASVAENDKQENSSEQGE